MGRLTGKVAIITGGARGLGEADARAFIAEGALVTITDLDQTRGSALAAELGCHFIQHDVSDESRWPKVIQETVEHFGKLDILVNNAGMVKAGNPENQTTEEYRQTMAVPSGKAPNRASRLTSRVRKLAGFWLSRLR